MNSAMTENVCDVTRFGARGDGQHIDTIAIQSAIDHAAHGGGIVVFPAGCYKSFSLRLKSKVILKLGTGATLIAATPGAAGHYDLPEENPADLYQDFGHNHWHNSLIWGEDIEDIAILGPGRIDGAGLTREGPGAPWSRGGGGDRPLSMGPAPDTLIAGYEQHLLAMNGQGNKAIALKNATRVRLDDFSLYRGGHIAILVTGGHDITMRNLHIDSNRDGIDIDCCSNVVLQQLTVNTPNDDAIVLKSSYALGHKRLTRNVTIEDCTVSGFDMGSMLDGTYRAIQLYAPDKDGVTGRIKLGTESCGGFQNITIRNCRFHRSRGLALECVDGGIMETIRIENITMQSVTSAPLFVRIGDRRRAPPGATLATARDIIMRQIKASDIDPRFAAIIAGLPDSPVWDITLEDIELRYRAGIVSPPAQPIPELTEAYPEPSMFGPTPAWGLYLRHARNVTLHGITLQTDTLDSRPPTVKDDVTMTNITAGTPHHSR